MELFRSLNGSPRLLLRGLRRSLCAQSHPLPPGWTDTLSARLVLLADPRASVLPVLEQWVGEGRPVQQRELHDAVKLMKSSKRYHQALQISMWMSDRRYFPLGPGDAAYRLELIYKTEGLKYAENYFRNIPKQLKLYQPYGALLNCYVEEKSVEKAEALFREMEELKMVSNFAYNLLLRLYSQTGQYERVDTIFRKMEKKGFHPDIFTYDIVMDHYATVSNIEGIEKLMERLKSSELVMNWHMYAVAAKGFMKAELKDKALAAIEKAEKLIPRKKKHIAYGFILTVYADVGNKDNVYRIWNKYKASGKASNSMYMCMISALVKLDDIDGAEIIFKEWESEFTSFDFRVTTLLVAAYCKKGLVSKAESLISKAMENGGTPYAFTWDYLAGGYFGIDETLKAVETMRKALMAAKPGWKPNHVNVNACLEYFIETKDVEGAEEFTKLLLHLRPLTKEVYHHLLRFYLATGKPVSVVLDQMKEDGFDVNEETNRILEEGG